MSKPIILENIENKLECEWTKLGESVITDYEMRNMRSILLFAKRLSLK